LGKGKGECERGGSLIGANIKRKDVSSNFPTQQVGKGVALGIGGRKKGHQFMKRITTDQKKLKSLDSERDY